MNKTVLKYLSRLKKTFITAVCVLFVILLEAIFRLLFSSSFTTLLNHDKPFWDILMKFPYVPETRYKTYLKMFFLILASGIVSSWILTFQVFIQVSPADKRFTPNSFSLSYHLYFPDRPYYLKIITSFSVHLYSFRKRPQKGCMVTLFYVLTRGHGRGHFRSVLRQDVWH